MKRLFYIAAAVLLFCVLNVGLLNAQLRFGLQSGLVFSKAGTNYTGEGTVGSNAKFLLTNATNLYVSYKLQPKFGIAFEPGYTQKATDLNLALTYIQFPILAEYNVVDKLYLTAGPEFNLLLNNDNSNSYKSFDTALQAGLYYGVSPTFDLGFKFSRSLFNYLREDILVVDGQYADVQLGNVNYYHYYFQFYTRYKF